MMRLGPISLTSTSSLEIGAPFSSKMLRLVIPAALGTRVAERSVSATTSNTVGSAIWMVLKRRAISIVADTPRPRLIVCVGSGRRITGASSGARGLGWSCAKATGVEGKLLKQLRQADALQPPSYVAVRAYAHFSGLHNLH